MENNNFRKMANWEQKKARGLIEKYYRLKRQFYKIKTRNELYEVMRPYLKVWIKSILKTWGKVEYKDSHWLLSVTWDAFEFCLQYYNPDTYDTPIPYFFYNYTRYYLLNAFARVDHVTINIDELQDILGLVQNDQNIAISKLLTLKKFTEGIPDEFKTVWEDSIQSAFCEKPEDQKLTIGYGGLTQNKYYFAKKLCKYMVKFIMANNI